MTTHNENKILVAAPITGTNPTLCRAPPVDLAFPRLHDLLRRFQQLQLLFEAGVGQGADPYLSTDTCVNELLHALLQDILVSHPKWIRLAGANPGPIGTRRNWLFHDGAEVRKSAKVYPERLRASSASAPTG